MQEHLQKILRVLAVRVLARYHPVVIAVAGSVGKTSTRLAVNAAVSKAFRAQTGAKNFNNEIGVPLSILCEKKTGARNPLIWLAIFVRGAWLAWGPKRSDYPNALVLEMATDHHGDIAYLTGIAMPDIAVVTAVSEEHTEFLGDINGVAKEEGTVVEALDAEGVAILNADDPLVAAMRSRTKAKVMTFGLGANADVRAEAIETEKAMDTYFTRFELVAKGKRATATLSGCIGEGNIYAALAASAVAISMGVKTEHVPFSLAAYAPPAGRLCPLPGIGGATLIDDTYNSSPRAAELALKTLMALAATSGARRVAVLGDMLELGELSEAAHRNIGESAAALGIDALVGVGPQSLLMCEAAAEAGMQKGRIHHFDTAEEAATLLKNQIQSGDVVLIKGSRGMHMERAVKPLMAEPERARELLVGQD